MPKDKPYIHLNSFLAKDEFNNNSPDFFLTDINKVNAYELSDEYEIDGVLFVKKSQEAKPRWGGFVESIVGTTIDELGNKSSSAVLIINVDNQILAFSFGYGRFLIDGKYFEQDFGIKTALNTLKHTSLRSVDLYSLGEEAVHKKAQAVRESQIDIFGIDIFKDILRSVTGTPKAGVPFKSLSGGDSVFSFGTYMDVEEIPKCSMQLINYYSQDDYMDNFSWVDNIRRIKDQALIDSLNAKLVEAIKRKDTDSVALTVPEVISWDDIDGFSFTRKKKKLIPSLEISAYYAGIDPTSVTIEKVKRDKLFIFDSHSNETSFSLYNCIYFEITDVEKSHILFGAVWYEVDNDFSTRIEKTLGQIPVSQLQFPKIYEWQENGKNRIECEGDYNTRAAVANGFYLLDKKLVKSNTRATPIELCDLMTANKELIHVKHQKGGSSSLSHLFAQGNVSAEVLLGDRDFRKAARKVLRNVDKTLPTLVPLDGFKSNGFEVVFLLLGREASDVKDALPFFSKVNLSKTYENLYQRGYRVSISGVGKTNRP